MLDVSDIEDADFKYNFLNALQNIHDDIFMSKSERMINLLCFGNENKLIIPEVLFGIIE